MIQVRPSVTSTSVESNRAMRRNIVKMLRRNKRMARKERGWYRRAYTWSNRIATITGHSQYFVASLAAVLSPSVDWRENRQMVIALLRDANATHFTSARMHGKRSLLMGYGANVNKARAMVATNDPSLLNGPKVTRFRDAILGHAAMVVDIHATNIAMGTENIYSGPGSQYDAIMRAYEDVAHMLGWRVEEVQAATWVIYKSTKPARRYGHINQMSLGL